MWIHVAMHLVSLEVSNYLAMDGGDEAYGFCCSIIDHLSNRCVRVLGLGFKFVGERHRAERSARFNPCAYYYIKNL